MVSQVLESIPLLIIINLIPLLLLGQSLTITSQKIGKALIEDICKKTAFPEECLSALESDPRSAIVSNMKELARIAVEITASKTNNSLIVAQYWVNHSPDYPSRKKASVCLYYYNHSVNSMIDSLAFFNGVNYEQSYQSVESVNDLVTACQKVSVDVLNDLNTMMLRLTDDVMYILHLLF